MTKIISPSDIQLSITHHLITLDLSFQIQESEKILNIQKLMRFVYLCKSIKDVKSAIHLRVFPNLIAIMLIRRDYVSYFRGIIRYIYKSEIIDPLLKQDCDDPSLGGMNASELFCELMNDKFIYCQLMGGRHGNRHVTAA